jgi:hypothetical protein
MGSAFCVALGLATCVLADLGADESGIHGALRATARLSFLLFWAAYSGSALASLFGPAFQPLKQRAREFGLAFAAAQLVHLGLVAWLCMIGPAPDASVFIFFGIAVAWVYLLALFSIPRLQQARSPKCWWLLRNVGMNYVAYAFAVDFLRDPLSGGLKHLVQYLPFAVLAVAGPPLRLAALAQRVGRRWSESTYRGSLERMFQILREAGSLEETAAYKIVPTPFVSWTHALPHQNSRVTVPKPRR